MSDEPTARPQDERVVGEAASSKAGPPMTPPDPSGQDRPAASGFGGTGVAIAVGAGIGIVFGTMLGNLALGLGCGAALGAVAGAVLEGRSRA